MGAGITTLLLCGTLLLVVPTKDGLVVAGDSRVSDLGGLSSPYKNRSCDEDFKLIEIQRGPERTVAMVTGGTAISKLSVILSDPDYCHYLRNSQTWIDIRTEFKSYIEASELSGARISITGFLITLELAFAKVPPDILRQLSGQKISQLIIAGYDVQTHESWLRRATLFLSTDLKPKIDDESIERFSVSDEKVFVRLGESDYVDQQFAAGKLTKYFKSDQTGRFATTRTNIASISKEEAISFVVDLIQAVSAAAQVDPPPTGIGGPVDVLFVGNEPRAQRIRWKDRP
jgi:hypothetical protein